MSLQHLGKGTLRVVKNYTKGYSDVQAKVRDATSNDPWGPSGTQMNELAQMTYNQNDFVEIMEMLDKRLNDKGKNWRHVFKALTVLDYCLHAGSENVVIYFRDNIYVVKTLKEFQYIDEYGKDQGANVRQKAKDITNLLQDETRLREERRSRAHMRDRMVGPSTEDGYGEGEDDSTRRSRAGPPGGRNAGRGAVGDDDELKRAIEASKQSLQEEQAQRAEENDLQKAIKLSQEEEHKRKQALEDANARSLFDDTQQMAPPASSNPFPLVDPTGNTPSLQPQIAQLQPQFTQVQPQFTSFNPYAQLQQQEAMQAEYLRNQQQWMQQQQQAQAQAQAQAQQEEWMRQQQLQQFQLQQQQQQPQQLAVQPTGFGSNNPFAPGSFSPKPSVSPNSNVSPSPSAPPVSFSSPNLTVPQSTSPAPQQPQQPAKKRDDGEHAHLANLFANRGEDGLDTFGNVGALRFGHTQAGLQVQKTGLNPFQQQQQQTSSSDQPFFSI